MKKSDDKGPLPTERQAERRPDVHAAYVRKLLDDIARLEVETRPSSGTGTAVGKDGKAFSALRLAGHLVDAVAGWALDHQYGLAIGNLEFLPSGTRDTKALPEFIELRAQVDSHEHERVGLECHAKGTPVAPSLARRILKNQLLPNPAGADRRAVTMLLEGLEALEFGEVTPIMERVPSKAHVRLREMRLQLQALAYVEFEVGQQKKRIGAQQRAADAFGVEDETIRTWEKRIRDDLGRLDVSRRLSLAKACGAAAASPDNRENVEYWNLQYGHAALAAAADAYKRLAASRAAKAKVKRKGTRKAGA